MTKTTTTLPTTKTTKTHAPHAIGVPRAVTAATWEDEPQLLDLAERAERALVLPFRAWVLQARQELEVCAANLRSNLRDYELLALAERHKAEPVEDGMSPRGTRCYDILVPPVVWAWADAALDLAEVEAKLVPFNAYFLAASQPANSCSLNFPQAGNDAAVRELWALYLAEREVDTDDSDGDA